MDAWRCRHASPRILIPAPIAPRLQSRQRSARAGVALHEFGHVLGLDHPDEYGQSVAAIMNSRISDTDSLQSDDVAGVRVLYGGGAAPQSSPGPPGNLTTSSSGSSVFLSWTAPSSGGAASAYVIEA